MIVQWLLLSACVCARTAFSYNVEYYGETFSMRMHRKAESIDFRRPYSTDVTVLWRHDHPEAGEDSRRKMSNGYYVISNVTQRDSGTYVMRDRDQRAVLTQILEVQGQTRNFERRTDERFSFNFHMEPKSCNIYFFSESDSDETQMVYRGRPLSGLHRFCNGFDLLKPCGISNDHLQYSCSGRYEVRDNNADIALQVFLEVEQPPAAEFDPSHIGFGIGAFLSALTCCCCLKRCCCGKSSDKDSPETPDAEPAVHHHEYDREPVGPGSQQLSQPSGTQYPAQPSYTPTVPLIHSHLPPAYSEVSVPAAPADAPTVPDHSDPEPRFELKGMSFPSAPPLSSDSTYCNVYNSDKLNFL